MVRGWKSKLGKDRTQKYLSDFPQILRFLPNRKSIFVHVLSTVQGDVVFEAKKMTLKEIVAAEMSDDCFGVLINDIFSVLKYEPNFITNVSYPLVIVQNRLQNFSILS